MSPSSVALSPTDPDPARSGAATPGPTRRIGRCLNQVADELLHPDDDCLRSIRQLTTACGDQLEADDARCSRLDGQELHLLGQGRWQSVTEIDRETWEEFSRKVIHAGTDRPQILRRRTGTGQATATPAPTVGTRQTCIGCAVSPGNETRGF